MKTKAALRTAVLVVLMLVFLIDPVLSETLGCEASQTKGRIDAQTKHKTTGWFAGGMVSGLLLGLVGTGSITLISLLSSPVPKSYPDEEQVNVTCYLDGYERKE